MKIATLVAAVLALAGACSSSSPERPTTQDERRAEIEEEQERVATESREDREAEGRAPDDERPDTWAEADAQRAGNDAERSAGDANDDADEASEGAARHEADNTGKNKRDDEPGNLTALDQSNSASDVDITQAIRKKVVADDALSFNAKNVKIITVSGKVTLRGPVESSQESKTIEQSARAVPGVVAVDNQIEVKR